MTDSSGPRFRRILLKLSGEALTGALASGIDPGILDRIAGEIAAFGESGVQVAVVIGGGNIFRGAELAARGLDRVTGDQMGMLATVINALAAQDALRKVDVDCRVMSSFPIGTVCELFDRNEAQRHLDAGRALIFAGGTGNPFFTTDSAASLRASEIGAELMIKATKVDGVYDADPVKYPDAKRFDRISYNEAITRGLGVMDITALVICRDNGIPLRVIDMFSPGALHDTVMGAEIGTLVCDEDNSQ